MILDKDHSAFAQQEKVLSSTNESNKVLGAIASNLFGNNFSRPQLPQQQPTLTSNKSNESNKVLGAIASNLWASNPNMMIGGYGPPVFNTSGSEADTPAKEKGFLLAEEKDFRVSYPLNWIKNKDLSSIFTGVHSTPIVSFSVPNFDTSTSKSSWVGISKYVIGNHSNKATSTISVLHEYVREEINELESDRVFNLMNHLQLH